MRHRYPFVEQASEEDCGAACVLMVARHYGKKVPMPLVRHLVGTGQQGTTLLGLRRGGDELGFHCRAMRTDVDASFFRDVKQIGLPVILHWEGNHWVVLYEVMDSHVVIADPGSPMGVERLDHDEFLERWGDGVLLTLEPDMARLRRQPDDQAKLHFVIRILRLAQPYLPLVARAMALSAVVGVVGLGIPLLMQVLTDDILVRRDTQLLGTLAIGMIALYLFREMIDYLQGKISTYFFERLELSLMLQYGHKLLRMPMQYFDRHRSGEILNRILELERASGVFNALLLRLPSDLFVAMISLLVMFFYSPVLTGVAMVGYLIIVGVQFIFLQPEMKLSSRAIQARANQQALLVELFRGAQLLKSTNAGPQAWDECQGGFGEMAKLSWQSSQLGLLRMGSLDLLQALLQIGLLLYGSTFVLAGGLSIGQLLAFSGMGMNVFFFIAEASRFLVAVATDRSIFRRLSDVFDGKAEEEDLPQRTWQRIEGHDSIELRNLGYAHPGRRHSLHNISTMIPGGKVTVLIGGSGSGKSTFAKLLAGMYMPASGFIRYGPVLHCDIAIDCLRSQVCLVTQDSHFFNRSIIDNFRLPHPEASYEEIVEACKLAMADDFIVGLPNGYKTVLGEFGSNLSGGQKQRLAIARALIGRPPVLILDESTNSLDPVLEAQLLEAVLRSRKGLTTVLISHRPSVISCCDFLIYFENGALKFQGPLEKARNAAVPTLRTFLTQASSSEETTIDVV